MSEKQLQDYLYEESSIRQSHEMSETGLKLSENRKNICQALKEIGQGGKLGEMIDAELLLVAEHLEVAENRDPVWRLELESVTLADEQMTRGLLCYDLFSEDIEAYKEEMERHDKLAKDKYPLDPFRVFLTAQRARLQNVLKMPYTESEKALLEVRLENINTMNRLYKALQKERLPKPIKERGQLVRYMAARE